MKESAFLKKLGKRVAVLRKERGLSQDKLYLASGLSRRTIFFIESGRSNPKVTTILKIAKTLNIPPSEIIDIK